ncbi:MAG: 3-isopropylmalate dehydrogenase, partial [Acetatifactor sp.]
MAEAEEKRMLQWHPAFYAGIRIEFDLEESEMHFESEHQLGTGPKEIDVLIIKKNSENCIQKNIGRIFRKYNIVEYKSPTDYLSIDDFYKVHAYACFYKSDTSVVDEIKAEEITISFVCKNYPRKLAAHLREVRNFEICPFEQGIYYIIGDFFPIQLIIISELSKENNFWLYHLTNNLQDSDSVDEVIEEYQKYRDNKLYQSVMDIIVRANEEKFEEKKNMCEALRELFKDELEEGIQQAT